MHTYNTKLCSKCQMSRYTVYIDVSVVLLLETTRPEVEIILKYIPRYQKVLIQTLACHNYLYIVGDQHMPHELN